MHSRYLTFGRVIFSMFDAINVSMHTRDSTLPYALHILGCLIHYIITITLMLRTGKNEDLTFRDVLLAHTSQPRYHT